MVSEKHWYVVPGFDWDEEHDLRDFPTWLLDLSHSWPPMKPMFAWFWMRHTAHGEMYTALKLSIPTTKGDAKRLRYGCHYVALAPVRDEEEIRQRQIKYREVMPSFIDGFDVWWEGAKDELLQNYSKLKSFDFDKATDLELEYLLHDLVAINRRMWELHHLGLIGTGSAWILFEDLCKELWGLEDTNPQFLTLMTGFDSKIFQVDKRLWQLSQDAIDKGLRDIFITTEASDVMPKLEQTEMGKDWLKGLRQFLDEDGWRMQRLHVFDEPTWVENPTPAIIVVKTFIAKVCDFQHDRIRERLAKEREEAVAAIVQRVPDERKDWFLRLLRVAQKAGIYNEEHTYYCEMYGHSVMRRCLLGIGRRLAQAGTIDRADDIFYLIPDEVERVIMLPEYHDVRYIVDRRRKQWEEWQKIALKSPHVITCRGSKEEGLEKDIFIGRDPIYSKISTGLVPVASPDLKADLYGIAAGPGVIEGPARRIVALDQLVDIQPGDILVAPNTATSWSPFFALLNGMVIEMGGVLAHAAIVGREYGIPVVVNVGDCSDKIKTGQKIRIDGNQGTVYILG